MPSKSGGIYGGNAPEKKSIFRPLCGSLIICDLSSLFLFVHSSLILITHHTDGGAAVGTLTVSLAWLGYCLAAREL